MGTERLVRRTAYTPGGTALRRCDAPGSGAQQQARREGGPGRAIHAYPSRRCPHTDRVDAQKSV
jgi:hypothetical protein